jgi:hypothetical protein
MNLKLLLIILNTTTDAPVYLQGNACMNTADQVIWNTTGQKNFRDYMNICGKQCVGNHDCTQSCVQKIEGYSDNCSDCFGDLGECSIKNCIMQCIGGDTPSCEECISSNCDEGFKVCSGLDAPKIISFPLFS